MRHFVEELDDIFMHIHFANLLFYVAYLCRERNIAVIVISHILLLRLD